MFVAPIPIGLSIVIRELRKRAILAVIFFHPHAISPIFTAVPFMIVIVLRVVVAGSFVRGSQSWW
jgi:hypothetical protein